MTMADLLRLIVAVLRARPKTAVISHLNAYIMHPSIALSARRVLAEDVDEFDKESPHFVRLDNA